MRALIVGDIHIASGFVNKFQKLRDIVISHNLRTLLRVAKNKADVFVMNGDIYDSANIAFKRQTILADFLETLLSTTDVSVVIVPGNHDMVGETNPYRFLSVNPRITVCNGIEKMFGITFIPWGSSLDEETEIESKLVVTHTECVDGTTGGITRYGKEMEKKLSSKSKSIIVAGHIHNPIVNKIGRFVIPGAFVTNGFDERGYGGAYAVVEVSNAEAQRPRICKADARVHYVNLDAPESSKNVYFALCKKVEALLRLFDSKQFFDKNVIVIRLRVDKSRQARLCVKRARQLSKQILGAKSNRVVVTTKRFGDSSEDSGERVRMASRKMEKNFSDFVKGGKNKLLKRYLAERECEKRVRKLCKDTLSEVSKG